VGNAYQWLSQTLPKFRAGRAAADVVGAASSDSPLACSTLRVLQEKSEIFRDCSSYNWTANFGDEDLIKL